MKISILCTNSDHPVINYLRLWRDKMTANDHFVSLVYDKADLLGGDILFLVSCSQLIRDTERSKYKATLVLHASDLPKGRGWSPYVWTILGGVNQITVSLLEATEPLDSGAIWLKKTFNLEGHELLDEINTKLFESELYLMTQAVEKFDDIKPTPQVGEIGKYMRKRTPEDSRIAIDKTIVEQFNLLRVADPERYPAFFEYKGVKYLIKIEKVNSETSK